LPQLLLDLPLFVSGIAIVGSLCAYSLAGLWLVRRTVLPRLRIEAAEHDFSSAMLQAVMVFYGLAVALIVVNVWQTHSDAEKILTQEASAAATLYRDVSSYPDPPRSRLQAGLRDYLRYVIDESWPIQQRGEVPIGGVELMDAFQRVLTGFEPASAGQRILHAETLRAYNDLIDARRLRLDAVDTRLPGILWSVVIVGAVISVSSSFLFRIEDARVQGIQVALLSAFIGLVVFLIFALDRPFHGELGLGPDAYRLVYGQLMDAGGAASH